MLRLLEHSVVCYVGVMTVTKAGKKEENWNYLVHLSQ